MQEEIFIASIYQYITMVQIYDQPTKNIFLLILIKKYSDILKIVSIVSIVSIDYRRMMMMMQTTKCPFLL